ncbi:MAG: ATP-binding protein [Candidatus Heimdallarchaeota archaeon]
MDVIIAQLLAQRVIAIKNGVAVVINPFRCDGDGVCMIVCPMDCITIEFIPLDEYEDVPLQKSKKK